MKYGGLSRWGGSRLYLIERESEGDRREGAFSPCFRLSGFFFELSRTGRVRLLIRISHIPTGGLRQTDREERGIMGRSEERQNFTERKCEQKDKED